MRRGPLSEVTEIHHSRRPAERTSRKKADTPSFEDSVGYRLATEGSHRDMGTGNTLQIWPQAPSRKHQQILGVEKSSPYSHSISETVASNRSRDDVSTLHSFRAVPRRQHDLSQQSSMYSVRDVAKFHKLRPNLHAASSVQDFHSADFKRKDDSNKSPKSSSSVRSQRLGFSRLFSRDKGSKPSKSRYEIHAQELEKEDMSLYQVRTKATLNEPEPPRVIQRSQNTVFDRNATENAKINVRRPPKGINHWFDGVSTSDEDLPEVVPSPVEQVNSATFRPSLGPSRQRAAPTSRISPIAEPSQDYFSTSSAHRQRKKSASAKSGNLQGQSMLNLSSSEDSEPSEPPSPERWHGQNKKPTDRHQSNMRRESAFSMQTTMTSGSIPIMNADLIYRTPLPPLPTQRPAVSDTPRTRSSDAHISRSRAATNQSIPESMRSDISGTTTSTTHVMTVTQEEMALLEMMRRKRAEMHTSDTSPQSARHHESQNTASRPLAVQRESSAAKSIASSIMSHNSERSVLGNLFPAPPSKSTERKASGGRNDTLQRLHSDEKILAYVQEEAPPLEPAPPPKKATRVAPTVLPEPVICHELEAPMLPAVSYSRPNVKPKESSTSSRSKTKLPVPPYNPADPYQLAPDLDFSPLDLLPLPARAYSPSLSTSRSSTGEGSLFSALTPDGSSAAGAMVVGSEVCELDIKRNSSAKGAGNDVLAAWGALGGI